MVRLSGSRIKIRNFIAGIKATVSKPSRIVFRLSERERERETVCVCVCSLLSIRRADNYMLRELPGRLCNSFSLGEEVAHMLYTKN